MPTPHVFLTRFNVPTQGREQVIRSDPAWLVERMHYFESFTVPSVVSQTTSPAGWIIYLDPESPTWLKDAMSTLHERRVATPIYRESVTREELVSDIDSIVNGDEKYITTSNLDNDDGLSRDFISRLASAPRNGGRTALFITHGLVRAADQVYLVKDRDNAFCAVTEDRENMLSCWADWHNRLDRHMPVVEIPGPPGWLQVVHGRNVSNRVRGRLVSPRDFAADFPVGLDGCATPSRAALLFDHCLKAPLRSVRDGVRSGAAVLVVRLFGKDGLTRVTHALAGLRGRLRPQERADRN